MAVAVRDVQPPAASHIITFDGGHNGKRESFAAVYKGPLGNQHAYGYRDAPDPLFMDRHNSQTAEYTALIGALRFALELDPTPTLRFYVEGDGQEQINCSTPQRTNTYSERATW